MDKKKITKLVLQDTVSGLYNLEFQPENSALKKKVTIESDGTKWYLKSNGKINVLEDGRTVPEIGLTEYNYYPLKIKGSKDHIGLFFMPLTEDKYYRTTTQDDNITIGSAHDSAIRYNHKFILPTHATISKEGGHWYITCSASEQSYSYLNDIRITKNRLKAGDIIFIYGLKIIWMGSFLYVYNPEERVTVNHSILPTYVEEEVDNTAFTPVLEDDKELELYKPDDYFFHVLRINPVIEPKEVKIDSPPGNQEQEGMPLIFLFGTAFMMMASSFMMLSNVSSQLTAGATLRSQIPQIAMLVGMLFGAVLMPIIMQLWQRRRGKKREKLRQTKYPQYIKDKVAKINEYRDEQRQVLQTNNPSLHECFAIAFSNSRSKWSREVADEDFLNIRLGISDLPSQIAINKIEESFSLDEDNLQDLVFDITNKDYNLESVPLAFSLVQNRITALICDKTIEQDYINGLILQMATYHSSLDLKLVFLLNDPNMNKWEYVKFLPHTFNDSKEIRFFADNPTEIKTVCSYLEDDYNQRKDLADNDKSATGQTADTYKMFRSYYLIITDDYMSIKNIPIINKILNSGENLGFSILISSNSTNQLPKQCNVFLQVLESGSQIIQRNQNNQIKFLAEYDSRVDMRALTTKLANIPLLTEDAASMLPTFLTFLDMYDISKVEQFNVQNRWRENNPVVSLQAPIGVHTSGEPFMLDLHERFHGPHGLVAGTTGSGKSEFLITYLLSMALNYHPDEVQFVIIDYKGGGLAGAFENRQAGTKIPHLVGTITNLDVSEMNRTLVSINSELKRRQKVFNDAREALDEGTIDIYKYQDFYRQGLVKEPMSHLLIVSDEFAELKAQQPDFMDELISAARIGRSLGVHLILATQKPGGVVTDQIWSNSKFKVCLKVQDVADSNDMLKRPEAASLKDAGRYYLQVGFDEYFDIGQSGWAGAKYKPSDRVVKTIDDSINFIDNVGQVYRTVNDEVVEEVHDSKVDQLISVVKYIIAEADKIGYKSKQLWRSAIPSDIFLHDLRVKYKYQRVPFHINPIIGEYDNPRAQFQGVLTLDITNRGNTLIYGQAGSGKENLLSTIIYSIVTNHHPSEVHMYIIDMGAETLGVFHKIPHIGDICYIDDEEKIVDLLGIVEKEIVRRKQLFIDYNGSYVNYCKNSGKTEPTKIIVINNYEVFMEIYEKYADTLAALYRDCTKFGIFFIVTTGAGNSVRARIADLFGNKICLQMADSTAYNEVLGAPRNLFPLKIFGRGIIALEHGQYEFQTAYIAEPLEINTAIRTAAELFKQYKYQAPRIPVIPESVTPSLLAPLMQDLTSVPIGVNMETKEPYSYNFAKSKINVLYTNDIESNHEFFEGLIKVIIANPNINLKIVDFLSILNVKRIPAAIANQNYDVALNDLYNEVIHEQQFEQTSLYIFIGIGEYKSKLTDTGRTAFDEIFRNLRNTVKTHILIADNVDAAKELGYEMWYDMVDKRSGIWLGQGVDEQYAISFTNITQADRSIKGIDIGFASTRSARIIFKKVVARGEEGVDTNA